MPSYIIPVPATTTLVKDFLNRERSRYNAALDSIMALVTEELATTSVYKIYSRKDKQGGDSLKHPRKVRLKFNDHFVKEGKDEGSLWTVPDIIGFTVVVAYPSDISRICEILDGLIDKKKLTASKSEPSTEPPIITKHGRAITKDGYFACHYNVSQKGAGTDNKPICEIQIKTILHDAWGAKSHDLTYKPSGKISGDLIKTFDVLGDMLAKVDEQSDIVRNSIERSLAVRSKKKNDVLSITIRETASRMADNDEIRKIVDSISNNTDCPTPEETENFLEIILNNFKANKIEACVVYCYVAHVCGDKRMFQQSLEAMEEWYESESTALGKALAKQITALACFVGNDTPTAIEEADHAISLLNEINLDELDEKSRQLYHRRKHSLHSSLAYYHAESIGSHDARLANSKDHAVDHIRRASAERANLKVPQYDLDSDEQQISMAIADLDLGWVVYSSLDNEAFVRIQVAEDETEVRVVRQRMDWLHKQKPLTFPPVANALFEFHDYCARQRLTELEKG